MNLAQDIGMKFLRFLSTFFKNIFAVSILVCVWGLDINMRACRKSVPPYFWKQEAL